MALRLLYFVTGKVRVEPNWGIEYAFVGNSFYGSHGVCNGVRAGRNRGGFLRGCTRHKRNQN